MAELRVGTCSWKYPSWEGLVYSRREGINFLEEYASRYDTVEIDQWFWSLHGKDRVSLPRPTVVREYAASVPEHFRFSVKVPNSITLTHHYRKNKTDALEASPHFLSNDLFATFLDTLRPMHHLLGPLLLQFEYLNREKMSGRGEFLDLIGAFFSKCPPGFQYGIETRNPNYLRADWFDALQQLGVHHVYLQGYYMPPVTEIHEQHPAFSPDVSVIRLHGPDRKGIEKKSGGEWNSILEARDEELDAIARMIASQLSRDIDVYVNVNNHYEGSAPLTIDRLRQRLG